jgi:hypothetical protein
MTEQTFKTKSIALEYHEHNLDMIKQSISDNDNKFSDDKRIEMSELVSRLRDLFDTYEKMLDHHMVDERFSDLCSLEKVFKLELIEKIVKF